MFDQTSTLQRWVGLPNLKRQVWILVAGQLMLFVGQGFTLVYASIYFVNTLGFSPTQVGLALGSGGISGTLGRFWAGNAIDSPTLGRRGTLLLAAAIAALGSISLAFATTFPLLVAGNLLLGLGISFYWPATLAATTDLTPPEHRTEAMALTRLADNLGLGLGAFLAGQYMALNGNFQWLFIGKGLVYWLFGIIVWFTITETVPTPVPTHHPFRRWWQALGDTHLLIYLAANLFFTTYTAQLSSTLPLYLANFVPGGNTDTGFSEQIISYFFVWHALLKILLQLPITRRLSFASHATVLLGALGLWAGGFGCLWLVRFEAVNPLVLMLVAFACVAGAEILYGPAASALVAQMAPVSLRGVYFALDSECWAIGFLMGPALGGWALDHPQALGENFWLGLLFSAALAGVVLLGLRRILSRAQESSERPHPAPAEPVAKTP